VSVVSDRAEISELSAALMNTARKDWMTLETLNTEMPLPDDCAELPLPAFAGAVPVDLRRVRDGRPGRPANHRNLHRSGRASAPAACATDEDEARRSHHRDAPADPGRVMQRADPELTYRLIAV